MGPLTGIVLAKIRSVIKIRRLHHEICLVVGGILGYINPLCPETKQSPTAHLLFKEDAPTSVALLNMCYMIDMLAHWKMPPLQWLC